MSIAYIECSAGVSGDMFQGAWLDLGIDEKEWRNIVERVNIDGYTISLRRVQKNGIGALKVDVKPINRSPEGSDDSPPRKLPDIYQIIDTSELPVPVKEQSKAAFKYLADAEGQVYGISPNEVNFHEVGTEDAIVDIVGAMTGWYLAGMPDCYVSPVEVGAGTVSRKHGLIPVPAPATALLLESIPTYSSGILAETVTPAGAAILKALRKDSDMPVMKSRKIGYGAGQRDLRIANVLRIQLGDPVPPVTMTVLRNGGVGGACVIEANIDDMTPEVAAHALTKLISLGAMDAWLTPIVMKKGRAAFELHVLCRDESRDVLISHIFRETTTIGVRHYKVDKSFLKKQLIEVNTRYGIVRVKVASDGNEIINVAPEFEDCRTQAEVYRVPLKDVYRAALSAYELSTAYHL